MSKKSVKYNAMLDNNKLKKNPFVTPEGYFDSLPSRIQDNCIATKKHHGIGLLPKLAFAGGFATVAVAALFISHLLTAPGTQTLPPPPELPLQVENTFDTNAMIDYLAASSVSVNDILLAKTKY
jgi:hypothetical protein